jgi:hypothetical protein
MLASSGFSGKVTEVSPAFSTLLKLATAAGIVASMMLVGVSQAPASHVQCGDTITQDTTLDSDLIDCPQRGIVVGAAGITLDLNGHVIDGPGLDRFAGFPGVDNGAAHAGVTVKNGIVQEFGLAVSLGPTFIHRPGADGNVVANLTIREAGNGVVGQNASDNNLLKRNFIESTTNAVVLSGSGNLVRKNDTSSPFTINGGRIIVTGERNTIEFNDVRFGGIGVAGADNTMRKNKLSSCVGGALAGGVWGGVGRGVIEKNVAEGCAHGLVVLGDYQVEKNRLLRNRGDGIRVEGGRSTLVGNVAVGNHDDDGIEVVKPGSTLSSNRANDNADLGIEAVPGTIDGGKNKARGNGNPMQCLNISCR